LPIGPAALINIKLSNGTHLLKGKKVTGFSNVEEDMVQLTQHVPYALETSLKDVSGGVYEKAVDPWASHVVVDSRVITGQNPASSAAVGEAFVVAMKSL
jgi:putative intracellular protease/amidase